MFPFAAPLENSTRLADLRLKLPSIQAGQDRSMGMQAVYQLAAIGITLALAIVAGIITGLFG